MIDLKAMSLSAVARRLPGRDGAHVNPSTVARWVHKGATAADGTRVKLAAVRVGATLFVTEEALAEFLTALNGPITTVTTSGREFATNDDIRRALAAQQRSPNARRKAADEAVRKLTDMGA